MPLSTLVQTTRPSFLILTPICLFLGASHLLATGSAINPLNAILIVLGATLAHISVNTLNEYFDFKSGLDLQTHKTPFSGGSGALPDSPETATAVLKLGVASLIAVILIGVYFMLQLGTRILPIGLLGVVIIITYTQWLNKMPLLCLIAPGLGFGIAMVVGTDLILSGEYSLTPWLVSLIPFFLVNNLLLLNQYPDTRADANVGRRTFPIVFGINRSNQVYAGFMIATYLLILIYIIGGYVPGLSAIALIPAAFAIYALTGAIKQGANIGEFPQYLGANVAATLLTPLLLGVAMVFG